ncbi:MAG TPA: outer membrane lipoprotein carrier protein LolA [Thermoanaerobaculia bacterium]|jgi:outer membrane lipoprotein-sorting protein|nr:outer membrane lipoprotein carrier protein LolA [Thermoanaerobaculia bacterium]
MSRPHQIFLALLVLGAVAVAAQEAADPWTVLKTVRQSLVEAGPTGASFVQTFTAAGFSSGDQESGRIALQLPDCMRWDYTNPFPKSFLLCGGTVHAWNEGDQTGRRYRVDRKNEPGLDLLLLGVDELKSRYQATAKNADGGRIEIALLPKEKKLAELTDATLTVDPASKRVVAVSYHDREGNLTRFEITGYQDLSRQGSFSPPSNVRWVEGSQ